MVAQRSTLEARVTEVQQGIKAAEAELEGAENEIARLQVGEGGGWGAARCVPLAGGGYPGVALGGDQGGYLLKGYSLARMNRP